VHIKEILNFSKAPRHKKNKTFIHPNAFKKLNLVVGRIFFSAAEFVHQSILPLHAPRTLFIFTGPGGGGGGWIGTDSVALSAEQFGQLLADFSGQFSTKMQPLRKNLVEGILPLETKLSLSMSARRVIQFLELLIIREKKNNKTNFPEVWPLFRPFLYKISQNSAAIFPATLLFNFLFGPF
jgi:hypothetical protein